MSLTHDQVEYLETLGYAPTPWKRVDEASAPSVTLPRYALWIVSADLESSGDVFASPTGQLLGKMCEAMGLDRKAVFVSPITPQTSAADLAVLRSKLHAPALVSFGRSEALSLREETFPVMVTHGLLETLSSPELKKKVWTDLQLVMSWLRLKR